MRLLLASGNPHKLAELRALLSQACLDVELHGADAAGGMPPVEETGTTFLANARLKAEALRAQAPAGTWILADDSGLEMDALDGAPGVRSARFAGPNATDAANVTALLEALAARPAASRTGRFVCVLVLLGPNGEDEGFDGRCEGRLTDAPRGSEGFGYDPVFIPEGHKKTFAELGPTVKDRISHRARAFQALVAFLQRR